MESTKRNSNTKKYTVELFANNKSIGYFEVEANSKEEAYEMAWGICETTFCAQIVNKTID